MQSKSAQVKELRRVCIGFKCPSDEFSDFFKDDIRDISGESLVRSEGRASCVMTP